jgi:replicative DNA helicase
MKKLSAPLYVLKQKAKALKKQTGVSLNQALDEMAKQEGYQSWSLLAAKAKEIFPKEREEILDYLNPGDLMLIAARPGVGKTTFCLQILLQAVKEGTHGYFFSLEYTHRDVASKVADLDESVGGNHELLHFDFSDEICSDYIVEKTASVSKGSVIVVDYLQLLDQKRSNPSLQLQVERLKAHAKSRGCIVIFISQVDRSFEMTGRDRPTMEDVRLPNPLDLKLFNKSMFLHDGKMEFRSPASFELRGTD